MPRYFWTALLFAGFACSSNEIGRLAAEEFGDLRYAPSPRGAFDAALSAACPDGGISERGTRVFRRRPYLQKVTHDSVTILWTSEATEPAAVTATVGAPPNSAPNSPPNSAPIATRAVAAVADSPSAPESSSAEPEVTDAVTDSPAATVSVTTEPPPAALRAVTTLDTTASPAGARQWTASFTDLEPNTTYCYRIEDAEGALAERIAFRTAPLPGSDEPIAFVTMGDLGVGAIDQQAVLDQLHEVEYDFALINGDVAYDDGTLADFEAHYFGVYADLIQTVPFFVASGNHDYNTRDGAHFREVFALFENGGPHGVERWYSFDWGRLHVVMLDTEKIGSAQARWLDADLAANELPWVVVVGHRPTYSSGHHGSEGDMRRFFRPIFEKHQVTLVFAGHDHDYERTHPQNGVTYIVAGAGGAGTRKVGVMDFTAFSQQVSHFVYVTIAGNTLTTYAIDATGQDFDTFRVRKPAGNRKPAH